MTRPDKHCGPCTLCCKVMAIPELNKPGGRWCEHQIAGRGCAIHGSHPASCRGFACQWLIEPDMPMKYRPDSVKVVLTTASGTGHLTAHCDPANPLAWRRRPIYPLLKARAAATWNLGQAVFARAGQRLWLITPDGEVDIGDVEEGSDLDIERHELGPPTVRVRPKPSIR